MSQTFNTLLSVLTGVTLSVSPISTDTVSVASKKPLNVPKCVVDTVWWEARGESLEGQLAVAHVIYNRRNHKFYGDTPCEVVTRPWQFAYTPVRNITVEYTEFSNRLRSHLIGQTDDSTQAKRRVGNSLYFVSKKNLDRFPKWYYTKVRVTDLGGHTFLK